MSYILLTYRKQGEREGDCGLQLLSFLLIGCTSSFSVMNFIGSHFFPVSMKDIYCSIDATLHFSFEETKIAKIDAKKASETEKIDSGKN